MRPLYVKCIDCDHHFTRAHGSQTRCPACQAVSVREKDTQRHKIRREQGLEADGWDRFYYVVEDDPLQPEWHGKINYQQVQEGCRLASFSEGTVLRYGHKRFKVVGKPTPLPFATAMMAQRLEEF